MKIAQILRVFAVCTLLVAGLSCSSSVSTPTPTPTSTPTPTLISDASELITPEPGDTISDNTPLFTWTSVTDVTNYQLQVATDPSFGTMVIDLFLGDVNAYEAENELANGAYYWRVKGTSSTIETPWSELGSFVIDA